jgi:type II secretory pathway pseudopilin PulG
MQRKNYLLKTYNYKNKSGFAMIMAIIVIVIISTIMALSLSLTTQTAKRTTDLYLYEQSVLYSKSAAELALLDIAQNAPCTQFTKNITFDGIYDANITMRYVYKGLSCGGTNDYFTTIQTDEQNGSVLMDITVTTNAGTEPIRHFRRSIQKL